MSDFKTHKIGGFTIIEVVLVLAIAGLIFLLVFLAFPALQRGQRDTQRRNDVGRFLSQLSNYQSNNKGQIPDTDQKLEDFVEEYLTKNNEPFDDPTHGPYDVERRTTAANPTDKEMLYFPRFKCDGSSVTNTGAGERSVAVMVKLETGGNYCQNN